MGRRSLQPQALLGSLPSAVGQRLVDRGLAARARGARCMGVMALVVSGWAQAAPAWAQDAADAKEESGAEEAAPPSEVTEKIDEAKKRIEQLDYTTAQQALFKVVQSGKATTVELAQAYFTLGLVEAALGNDVESTDSFYLALMIQPQLVFPEGGSPKIRQRLNEARSRVTEVGVLQSHASVKGGVLDVHLDNDPLKLVKRIDVLMTREGGESGKVTLEKGTTRAEVEPGVKTIQVVMYDDAGNQLQVLDVDPTSKGSGGSAAGLRPSVWENWGLWAGVAGALALGGTYFIMESGSLDDDIRDARDAPNPNPAEVSRLEDNQDRVGLYGVIGLSMAGAAALTSGALLFFGGGDKAKDSEGAAEAAPEASLVPTVAPGHLGARFTLRF